MATFNDPVDVATPPGTGESRRQGDDRMREIKRAVLERLAVEHDFPVITGAGQSGRHKFASGNTAGQPANKSTGTIYINTQTGMLEYWTGAVWAAVNPAYLPLAGGTMTGGIVLPNEVRLSGQTVALAVKNLIRMANTNTVIVGDPAQLLQLQASANPSYAGNTLWHTGNDGAGSGLDADLVKGKSLTLLYVVGSAGYCYCTELNGIFFQWGRNNVGASSSSVVALPIAYGTSHSWAMAGFYSSTGGLFENCAAQPFSLSQVVLYNNTPNLQTISWLSIGA